MKYSVLGNVCFGLACLMVMGCSNSELSTAPESPVVVGEGTAMSEKDVVENIQAPVGENLTTYLKAVEDKLGQLKEKHAKLANGVSEAGSGSKAKESLGAILDDLTKKSEEFQFQIEAMKSAKGGDQPALQADMDKALADLDQSYDTALAQFAG